MDEQNVEKAQSEQEAAIARLVTASLAGRQWREMTPLAVAKHLVASGVSIPPEAQDHGEIA